MNFLLDTNVVSECTKPRPNSGLLAWLDEVDEDRVYLSTVTLAALRFGVELMPTGERRDRLDKWLSDELPRRFDQRVALVTAELADLWGRFMARGRSMGRPVGAMDALIAATAVYCGFTLVTRNVSDFEALDVPLLNPWHDS